MNNFRFLACVSAVVLFGQVSFAAEQPDAGQTLQNLHKSPTLPAASPNVSFDAPVSNVHKAGGPQVTVRSITITGNDVIADDVLLPLLDDAQGQSFDLAGMKGLADRITVYYHNHDYPFARAFIPTQSMKGDVLNITVVEGRYGNIETQGDDARAGATPKFLTRLGHESVIEGRALERVSLILDDQPGYRFMPVIRPGQDMGTGDLSFRMEREERFGGNVRIDNQGNRYTGRVRGQLGLYANSPFMFGDQININTVYTEEQMWFGSIGYNAPIGGSGLRGNVGYAHTDYELGKQFSSLDAHGTAKIASAGLSYPIIRSQKANLSLSVNYQHKWLTDEQGASSSVDKKSSDVVPVALNFDARDGFFGGGVTYGMFSITHGILDLDSGLAATDATTAQSKGSFNKVNLDVARLQALPINNFTFFGRMAGQLAGDNLDSTEDFGLGGPSGVRAYPVGESYGDEGALGQAELRYQVGHVAPYVFYDYGHTRTNDDPWTTGDNDRSIGGAGIGMCAAYKGWNADMSAAWRTVGGDPKSDDRDTMPMVWLGLGYTF